MALLQRADSRTDQELLAWQCLRLLWGKPSLAPTNLGNCDDRHWGRPGCWTSGGSAGDSALIASLEETRWRRGEVNRLDRAYRRACGAARKIPRRCRIGSGGGLGHAGRRPLVLADRYQRTTSPFSSVTVPVPDSSGGGSRTAEPKPQRAGTTLPGSSRAGPVTARARSYRASR
jgi:hypothetical protein